jgi:hypothetical protein
MSTMDAANAAKAQTRRIRQAENKRPSTSSIEDFNNITYDLMQGLLAGYNSSMLI